MLRCIAAALMATWMMVPVWGQTSQTQPVPEQAGAGQTTAAGQTSADRAHPAEQPAAAATPAGETTEYPLDRFQNFSAIVSGSPLPQHDDDRYIYRSGNLMRVQGDAPLGNYFVTDLAARTSQGLAASGCIKLGSPSTRSFPFFVSRPGVTYEVSQGGEETIDGHQCRIEDVKVHDPKNPVVINFRLYEAEDLQGFPIEIKNLREKAGHWVIKFKDVRIGPQDPTLFLVPRECQSSSGFRAPGAPAKSKPGTAPAAKPQ